MKAKAQNLLQLDDGSPASELAKRISELSEDTYCATWESDQEYDYWQLVLNPPTQPLRRGMGEILPEDIAELKKLSDLAGGWVYWYTSTAADKEEWFAETGVRFIPMEEWLARYAEKRGPR